MKNQIAVWRAVYFGQNIASTNCKNGNYVVEYRLSLQPNHLSSLVVTGRQCVVLIIASEPLHNSLRSVISRTRAACCVVFLANSRAIGRK